MCIYRYMQLITLFVEISRGLTLITDVFSEVFILIKKLFYYL